MKRFQIMTAIWSRYLTAKRDRQKAEQPTQQQPVIIYKPPSGINWRPMWDAHLNYTLECKGVGWRNYEAIEIWRDTSPVPGRIFTCQIMDRTALNVAGLYWRPLLHSPRVDRVLN